MPSCCICSHVRKGAYKKDGISFHRISKTVIKDDGICEQWMEFFKKCGKDWSKVTLSSTICSKHFKQDDILNYLKYKTLKENAVPTIIVHQSKRRKAQISFPKVSTQLTRESVNGCTEMNSIQTDLEGISPLPNETHLDQMICQPSTSTDSFSVDNLLNTDTLLTSESVNGYRRTWIQTDLEGISPLPNETHLDQMICRPSTSTDIFFVDNLLNTDTVLTSESVNGYTEINSIQTDLEGISPLSNETHLDLMICQPSTSADSFSVDNLLNTDTVLTNESMDLESISSLSNETHLDQIFCQSSTNTDSFSVDNLLNTDTVLTSESMVLESISSLPNEAHLDQMFCQPSTSTDSFSVDNLLNTVLTRESGYRHTDMNSIQTDLECISPLPTIINLDQMCCQPSTSTECFSVDNLLNTVL